MEKIKLFFSETLQSEKGKDVLIVIIVILVGLGSFELGRLSKQDNTKGVEIEYTEEDTEQPASVISYNKIENPSSQNFFASSRGTKYYSIGCSAGKTIKQENRVYFTTSEEAQTAGYELSSSCR